ncbi:MAG: hypothetical protein M3R38_05990 [Actinomycetota bacterium]|nr:hypothetical protein [Actinomycetota bacterium]
MRGIERIVLRLRGLDPEVLEGEWKRMDEAKAKREAERENQDAEARRRYVDMRMRRGDQWR